MKPAFSLSVPVRLVVATLALVAGGCASTETPAPADPPPTGERAAAVADMRARAAATEAGGYPNVFAATPGPSLAGLRSVSEVEEIEARLSALAASRASGSIGDGQAASQRTELLRRLAIARQREIEQAIASRAALQ